MSADKYQPPQDQFDNDVAGGKMDLLRDDGRYRHLRFHLDGGGFRWFDIVSMSDEELTALAAKAFGNAQHGFSPLSDDGDALRLAVKLKIRIGFRPCAYADTPVGLRFFGARDGDDQFSRTRLAIVRAAAAIGQAIRTQQGGRG